MKLHLRNVLHYAMCNSPADKEGYLSKKGELNTAYHRRWFVLRGNILFYFDRKGDREPLGLIILENVSIQLCESAEEHAFAIVYDGPNQRTYKLAADDQQTMEAWLKVLLSATFTYIRMIVRDLKSKYEEAYLAAERGSYHRHTVPDLSKKATSIEYLDIDNDRTATSTGRVQVPNTREGRSYSMNAMPAAQSKATKKSAKPWSKRPVPLRPQSDNTHAASGLPQSPLGAKLADDHCLLTEDFSSLHEKFGAEIQELRHQWQKKEGLVTEAIVGDLINLS